MKRRNPVNAQRVALYLVTGIVPVVACHTCHIRSCVRPSHLYDGTHQTNGRDKALSGRAKGKLIQVGEVNHNAKVTDEIVRDIRTRTLSTKEYAERYGITDSNVRQILLRRSWRHVI